MEFIPVEFRHALVMFLRGLFAAVVGAAVKAVLDNYLTPGITADALWSAAIQGAVTGAMLFAGAYLRTITTEPVAVPQDPRPRMLGKQLAGPHHNRTRSWADNLPF